MQTSLVAVKKFSTHRRLGWFLSERAARIERMFESDAPNDTGLISRLPAGAVDCPSLSDTASVDVVAEAERLIAQLHAVQLDALAELTTRPFYAEPVKLTTPDFAEPFQRSAADAAAACRWSRHMAEHRTLLGEQLRDKLPGTLAALREGRIDLNRARAVAEATEGFPAKSAAAVEERVLTRAPHQTTTQLRAALRRAVLAIDPAAAQRRHDEAVAERRVEVRDLPDGMAELTAPLRADKAEAVYARLTDIARQALENYRAVTPDGADANSSRHAEPSMNSLRADALLWLVLGDPMPGLTTPSPDPQASPGHPGTTPTAAHCLPDGAAACTDSATHQPASADHPGSPGMCPTLGQPRGFGAGCAHCGCARPRPLLNLHMPLGTALGLSDEPAELSGYGPIPASLARELAADATWRRIFTDPVSGTTIATESASYQPPASMAALVRARDGTCRFPGCRQPASRADIDHRLPWPHGSTCPCNLCCLCRFHHMLKTHYGWRYTLDPTTGVTTWTSPSGHRYTTLPARIPDGAKRNVDESPERPDVPQSS